MDGAASTSRGVAFPPRVGPDGRFAWSAGAQNVADSILIILATNRQERLMRPDFGAGLRAFLFEPNTAATRRLIQDQITQALQRWERRIDLQEVRVEPDASDQRAVVVTIRYQFRATGTGDQVSLRVPVASDGGD